jgi:hypothetical protein
MTISKTSRQTSRDDNTREKVATPLRVLGRNHRCMQALPAQASPPHHTLLRPEQGTEAQLGPFVAFNPDGLPEVSCTDHSKYLPCKTYSQPTAFLDTSPTIGNI